MSIYVMKFRVEFPLYPVHFPSLRVSLTRKRAGILAYPEITVNEKTVTPDDCAIKITPKPYLW
jgi:hypothetical protein